VGKSLLDWSGWHARTIIAAYERYLSESGLIKDVHELAGRDLVCWCAPLPCHGDVLIRVANQPAAIR
jgi:hypothetical protein